MKKIIALIVFLVAACMALTGCTAAWQRTMKSTASNWTGGLNRTVSVYSESGELIKSWSGKFDVDDSDDEVFFDLNGKRVIIHGGIVINEEQ